MGSIHEFKGVENPKSYFYMQIKCILFVSFFLNNYTPYIFWHFLFFS